MANPNSVFEIPRSILKSIKNIPNTCLTLKDIRTTRQAAIKVVRANLLVINLSVVILKILMTV